MKRLMMIILAIVLCFVFHPELNASIKTKIRAKGGVNFAKFKGAKLNGFRGVKTTRAAAGASVGFHITRNSAVIELGILYSEKGAKLMDSDSEACSYLTIKYLEIPLLIKWEFASINSVKPYVFGGAYFAKKLKATNKAVCDIVEPVEINPKDDVKKGDWGITFGGGLQLGRIILEARYSLGRTNVIRDMEDSKNSVLTFMLGYEF